MHRLKTALASVAILLTATTAQAATYYVAPGGNDSAPGSISAPWQTIAKAQARAAAGDTIYFRGGTYAYTAAINACSSMTDTVNAITLNKSGEAGNPIKYWAYPGEVPVFDFSRMTDNCRIKGFNIVANYLHLKGLEMTGVQQHPENFRNHESWGIWIRGSNNIFEMLNTHHHMGPGLFLKDGANNLVLNVDSHHNYDPMTSNGAGQSADGFGAHVGANQPGNVFRGCRAWANSDDGFDLIKAESPILIENSWAWSHGYLPATRTALPAGNGNGFKIGGFGGGWHANAPKHTVRFSVAFDNKANGFYANHHPVASDFFNNTSVNNGVDFNMLGVDSSGAPTALGKLRNNIAFGGKLTSNIDGADVSSNSWNLPVAVSAADFRTVSTAGWDAPRAPDGSLLPMPHFKPASGSVLPAMGALEGSFDRLEEMREVTMTQLLANPRQFDGMPVRLIAFLNVEFEGNALYLHREDFEKGLRTNAVWISLANQQVNAAKKVSGGYVIVDGIFIATDRGHKGMYSGAVRDITRLSPSLCSVVPSRLCSQGR
jgi:hypothetical protein